MNVHTRLEVNAIIDRLVADSSTFSRSDARRLINLIPVTPRPRFSLKGIFQGGRSGFRGHAAGLGDVELKEEANEKKITLNIPVSHKIGGYVVTHTPGAVNIELMWAESKEDQSGQSCILVYDVATKQPKEMRIAAQKTLPLLFLIIKYISYIPWKRPNPA